MKPLNDPLPSPIHHTPIGRIDPAHAKRLGKIILRCIDCGHECLAEPGNGFERCWQCKQPQQRRAP